MSEVITLGVRRLNYPCYTCGRYATVEVATYDPVERKGVTITTYCDLHIPDGARTLRAQATPGPIASM